ncbi:MAG: alpha-glucan family phosphorylase [Cyanobacteria bacterium J06632_22]
MNTRQQLRAKLPAPLRSLAELAYNYWWSWTPERLSLFRVIAPDIWQQCQHNPVALLEGVTSERLWQLAENPHYLKRLQQLSAQLDSYLSHVSQEQTWAAQAAPHITPDHPVAYFCIEFGIHESLPLYCGGLGVLAGDFLKSASDLGLPVVGVGLFYYQGYFTQQLNRSGWQEDIYANSNPDLMPIEPVCNEHGQRLKIRVLIRQRRVKAQVWQVQVGRSLIYLLDTNLPDNDPLDRRLTERLYAGNPDTQIAQSMLLGIGGVQLLQALGYEPSVYHLNEVHAAFATLELARFEMEQADSTFAEAQANVKARTLFTTHTPVPTGHVFPVDMMDSFMADYWPLLDLSREDFLALGTRRQDDAWEPFSMTVLTMRMARSTNGVSRRHGEVSRKMWQVLYPDKSESAVPISHITNGVHIRSWVAPLMEDLFDDYLGKNWSTQLSNPEMWSKVEAISDEALWQRHQILKARLIAYTRDKVRQARTDRGEAPDDINAVARMLDPKVLTLGFARRFSAYKRNTLIFRDLQRATRIFSNPKRPIQIIFAGKAHPSDEEGKRLIQRLMEWSRHPALRDRIAFIEDYDMYTTKLMVQGVDLWLNTPRRPLEASGTSGQKIAINGGLNFSVLDGWWGEGYKPQLNGWKIGQDAETTDQEVQNDIDAESFYAQLEREIVRLYYDQDRKGVPHSWVKRMKASIRTIAPYFNSDRMVSEYVTQLYLVK